MMPIAKQIKCIFSSQVSFAETSVATIFNINSISTKEALPCPHEEFPKGTISVFT
jgi:hypothetical protein